VSATTAPLATAPPTRAKRPGVGTVYRWELAKLRHQKRTYLGLGAAAIVPILFVVTLHFRHDRHGGDFAFSSYLNRSGLAVPLVILLFGAVWLFPLITALVAGDIFASEDHNGTLKTILTRSLERWQIFAGKGLAAWSTVAADVGTYAIRLRVSDGKGGSADQNYVLSVLSAGTGINYPPAFTSTPPVDAYVGVPYTYQPTVADVDYDSQTLSANPNSNPAGLSLTSNGSRRRRTRRHGTETEIFASNPRCRRGGRC